MRLLVSVGDVEEAIEAVLGGADIIDVKNPQEGSLGAQPPAVVRAVREATPAHLPVSAALGDLPDLLGTAALAALGAAVLGVSYVKVGLAGVRSAGRAAAILGEVARAVAGWTRTRVVAVGFADGPLHGAVGPFEVLEAASGACIPVCMIDTLEKGAGRSLPDLLPPWSLRAFVDRVHGLGMEAALAGSLRAEHLPTVAWAGADIVGVRGAACNGDRRSGRISRERVARLKQVLLAAPRASPALFLSGGARPPDRGACR